MVYISYVPRRPKHTNFDIFLEERCLKDLPEGHDDPLELRPGLGGGVTGQQLLLDDPIAFLGQYKVGLRFVS